MYFIDKKIYYGNELQEPRKIYCNSLRQKGDMASFYDADGNEYIVSRYELYTEKEINTALEKAIKEYNAIKYGIHRK